MRAPPTTLQQTRWISAVMVAVSLAVVGLPVTALAASGKPPEASSQAKAISDADKTKARALFEEATAAYKVGDFEKALKKYQEAYALAPLPGFLFNIGQCHMQLGQYEKAVFSYESFLREAPNDDPVRPEAEERLAIALFNQEEQKLLEEKSADTAEHGYSKGTLIGAVTATAVATAAVTATLTLATVYAIGAWRRGRTPDPTLGEINAR